MKKMLGCVAGRGNSGHPGLDGGVYHLPGGKDRRASLTVKVKGDRYELLGCVAGRGNSGGGGMGFL